jgi:hypothetical protein
MDIERLTIVLEDIFKESLEENVYHFGLSSRKGISNKIASGSLRNSIKAIPQEGAIGIEMNTYWRFVQSGRKSSKKGVPVDALERWIKERGLTGRDKKGKRMSTRSFAFAIQRNIKKFGIPSKPGFLDVAVMKMYESKELADVLGDITVDELIDHLEGI